MRKTDNVIKKRYFYRIGKNTRVSGVIMSGALALSGAASSLAWSVFTIVSIWIILCCSCVGLADPGAGTVGGGPDGLLLTGGGICLVDTSESVVTSWLVSVGYESGFP